MPKFSQSSLDKLSTCHPDLQRVFNEVVKYFDCTIICGHRGEADQNKAFAEGKSQKKWPHGKHNTLPSLAVDAIPSPIDWKDRERMVYFAGFVVAIAATLGIKIRWGNDWDRDTEVKDNSFDDLPHFEVV